jgi:hypothetical protein
MANEEVFDFIMAVSCEKLMLNYNLIYFTLREHFSAHLFFLEWNHTENPFLKHVSGRNDGKMLAASKTHLLSPHV